MDTAGRERLEAKGSRVGTVAGFLGLSQGEIAERIAVSTARVAKMEAGDPHVSLDLMIRALLAAGMTRGGLAAAIVPDAETAG